MSTRCAVRLRRRIGQGSFGAVYEGYIDGFPLTNYAVKIESSGCTYPKLRSEAHILRKLSHTGVTARFFSFGQNAECSFLVSQLMGMNLEQFFESRQRCLSPTEVARFAVRMIDILHVIHSSGYVHRDVKPENFVFGTGENADCLFLVDFGLSKRFIEQDGHIRPRSDKKGLTGTARFASIWSHMGNEQSRRDDMESLAYVLLYLLLGYLPWQGIRAPTKELKFAQIAQMKTSTRLWDLGGHLPSEFLRFLEYARQIPFDAAPNYDLLRSLFADLIVRLEGRRGAESAALPIDGLSWSDSGEDLRSKRLRPSPSSAVATDTPLAFPSSAFADAEEALSPDRMRRRAFFSSPAADSHYAECPPDSPSSSKLLQPAAADRSCNWRVPAAADDSLLPACCARYAAASSVVDSAVNLLTQPQSCLNPLVEFPRASRLPSRSDVMAGGAESLPLSRCISLFLFILILTLPLRPLPLFPLRPLAVCPLITLLIRFEGRQLQLLQYQQKSRRCLHGVFRSLLRKRFCRAESARRESHRLRR